MQKEAFPLIRVGIVDDHPVVALGTATVLNAQSDIYVTSTASTVRELLAFDQALDVVLLDPGLADHSDFLGNIRSLRRGGARVLAYVSGESSQIAGYAVHAGAVGVLEKTASPTTIVDAVREAARGDDHDTASGPDRAFSDAGLSAREREVLALYASGETAARVARRLFISAETVYDHIRRIRGKYAAVGRSAPSKVDLFHRAVEDRIILDR